jgi:hypothetical protein
MMKRICRDFVFYTWIGTLMLASVATAQSLRNQAGLDVDIPTPTPSRTTAPVQDQKGLAELNSYAAATGLEGWHGMHAFGTTEYSDGPAPLATKLDMLPGNRSRLVVTTTSGDRVLATNGPYGHLLSPAGKDQPLPALSVNGGILPFDLPSLVLKAPGAYTVIDGGTVNLGDQPMRRVTIEAPIPFGDGGVQEETAAVVDFYFDPSTHLLRKTASLFMVPGAGRHRFVRVLTYDRYAASGSIQVPTHIYESLDGKATWSLTLSSIDTSNPPADSTF